MNLTVTCKTLFFITVLCVSACLRVLCDNCYEPYSDVQNTLLYNCSTYFILFALLRNNCYESYSGMQSNNFYDCKKCLNSFTRTPCHLSQMCTLCSGVKTTVELCVSESCTGVECGEGKQCVIRRGRPKCVCSPDCRKSRHKGPVCGTDGRSYRSVCRLRKRACRRKSSTLAVAYYGHCQSKSRLEPYHQLTQPSC